MSTQTIDSATDESNKTKELFERQQRLTALAEIQQHRAEIVADLVRTDLKIVRNRLAPHLVANSDPCRDRTPWPCDVASALLNLPNESH